MEQAPLLGLRWALKISFQNYIAASPGGSGTLGDGAVATAQRQVVFAPVARQSDEGGTLLQFRGTVTFNAHFGALYVRISDPWVTIGKEGGELSVVDPFDTSGNARLRIAMIKLDDHLIADGYEHWVASDVRLAAEGCALFNDVYPAGTLFEPIAIIIPQDF